MLVGGIVPEDLYLPMNGLGLGVEMRAPATGTISASRLATRTGRKPTAMTREAAVGGVINTNINIVSHPASRQGVSGATTRAKSSSGHVRQVYDRSFFIGELRNRASSVSEETQKLTGDIERLRRAAGQSARLRQRVQDTKETVTKLQGELYDLNSLKRRSSANESSSTTAKQLQEEQDQVQAKCAELEQQISELYQNNMRVDSAADHLQTACSSLVQDSAAELRRQLGTTQAAEYEQLTSDNAAMREQLEILQAELRAATSGLVAAEKSARLDPTRHKLLEAMAAGDIARRSRITAAAELADVETELNELQTKMSEQGRGTVLPAHAVAASVALSEEDSAEVLRIASKTLFDSLKAQAEKAKVAEAELRAKRTVLQTAEEDSKQGTNDPKQTQLASRAREFTAFLRNIPKLRADIEAKLTSTASSVNTSSQQFYEAAVVAEQEAREQYAGSAARGDASLEAELARATDELRRCTELETELDQEQTSIMTELRQVMLDLAAVEGDAQLTEKLTSELTPAQLKALNTQLEASREDLIQQTSNVSAAMRRSQLDMERSPQAAAFENAASQFQQAAEQAERARLSLSSSNENNVDDLLRDVQSTIAQLEAAITAQLLKDEMQVQQ